ncbi:SnoaL-like domain-containing protein [Streptomyces zhaozhouensis]|uniref:SnoaL-like domain-containing protein n=1 Tax=Streptomyces zhaozhouensis TaxID=1300267 RepID=A0A286DHU9_9ACTN|nr:nuclear transport factor 2 family protein [Streptomyces zhaozhouensis]SOD58186.1 SnoaL-like domain-containing protein [Streptomyces zhaozhouensis]
MNEEQRHARDLESLYERWITALWNGPADVGELTARAETVVAGDFVGHWPDGDVRGPDGLGRLIAETKGMFTALSFTVEVPPFAGGDLVAGRWVGRGRTSEGPVEFFGNDILRAVNGRFAEYWVASGQR